MTISKSEFEELQREVRRLSRESTPKEKEKKFRNLPNVIPKLSATDIGYLSWSAIFKATIEDVPEYTYAQKLSALVESTQHLENMTPLSLYDTTADGYQQAMKYVDSLFGDKEKIVEKVIGQLENLDPVVESDLALITQLRACFLSARTCAEITGKLASFQHRIRMAVMAKLPVRVHMTLTDLHLTADNALKVISEELDKEVIRTRELESRQQTTTTLAKKRPAEQHSKTANTTDGPFKTPGAPPTKKKPFTGICRFDGGRHHFRDCTTPYQTRLKNTEDAKLCHNCLGPGHTATECWSRRRCAFCKEKHHSMLCPTKANSTSDTAKAMFVPTVDDTVQGADEEETPVVASKAMTSMCFKTTVFQEPESLHNIRCLVDEGSGKNFVTTKAVTRLGLLPFEGRPLKIHGFGTEEPVRASTYVEITLKSLTSDTTRTILFCVVQSIGNGDYPTAPEWVLDQLSQEQRTIYTDNADLTVEMIIGIHEAQAWLGDISKVIDDVRGRYSCQESDMGLFVYGGPSEPEKDHLRYTYTINELVAEVEMSDIVPPDTYVEDFMKEHVRPVNGRIEVDVPLVNRVSIQDNTNLCFTLLKQNYLKWQKKEKLDIVKEILEGWKADGIIEPVTDTHRDHHTLSYHVVEKLSSSTTKHRLVFNGSLKDYFANHLNQKVFKGTTSWKIINSFIELRRRQFPLVGDLRQAFLMVSIAEEYRDLFQFLWPHDEEKIPYRFTRVPFGTSASPFLLFVALCKVVELSVNEHPELKDLIKWFYVDDIVCSFDTPEIRDQIRRSCEEVLLKYGFPIGWADEEEVKVLGLKMFRSQDQLQVIIDPPEIPKTVRDLAALIPKRFDPCGFTEPMDGELRRVFSQCWKQKLSWNDDIPESELARVKKVISVLMKRDYSVPLWLGLSKDQLMDVHLFTDANDQSIGAAIYSLNPVTSKLVLVFTKVGTSFEKVNP